MKVEDFPQMGTLLRAGEDSVDGTFSEDIQLLFIKTEVFCCKEVLFGEWATEDANVIRLSGCEQ